jgi:ribosomal protein S18 acetylase RimI-like enzyme
MGLEFRKFRNDDARSVVNLFNACFAAHRTLEEWRWMYLQMPGFDTSGILVCEDEDNGQLVGSVLIAETNILINGRKHAVGMINDVDTLPKWRGRGVATKLMEIAIDEGRRKGYSALFLYANPFGEAAGIYRRIGFKDAQYFSYNGKMSRPKIAAKSFPFPMNLLSPLAALASGINSRRYGVPGNYFQTKQLDCRDKNEFESYLEALNGSLGNKPLFCPYSKEQLLWMLKDAPKTISPVARFVEKSGKIVCGANASIFRMHFLGKKINSWAIADLFASDDLDDSMREACIRSVIGDLVEDGEARNCAIHMVPISKFDKKIARALRPCGFFGFVSTTFMCLPLKNGFRLPPTDAPWYSWKQHMIGVP